MVKWIILTASALSLAGCGAMTGMPWSSGSGSGSSSMSGTSRTSGAVGTGSQSADPTTMAPAGSDFKPEDSNPLRKAPSQR